MTKSLFFLLTLLFLPVLVRAQITSLNVAIEPDGPVWREVVENHCSSSVVAVRTTFQKRTGHTKIVVAYDSVTNYGTVHVIPSGGIGHYFAQDPSEAGGVDTAVFSDGHSEGDPQGVKEIYERRRGNYKAIVQVLPLLDKIVSQGASPTEVADTIHRFAIPNDGTTSAGERQGLGMVYTGVENLLRRQDDITGLYDPTKYPPQPSIDEVAKVKGVAREQAHAMVIREKYRRLEAFLQDNLEPPAAE